MTLPTYKTFKEGCQARGFKATTQRYVIFKTLVKLKNHPSADQLFELVNPQTPGLSRDTVYRTLNILVNYGLIRKLMLPGGACRFDGDLSIHHHFYCEFCGMIYDISWPEFDKLPLPDKIHSMGIVHRRTTMIVGRGSCCAKQ